MTQQTTITDENGKPAEVRDSDPTATSRALVVRVAGAIAAIVNGGATEATLQAVLTALGPLATEGTLADLLNETIALRGGTDLETLRFWLETIALAQQDGSQRSRLLGLAPTLVGSTDLLTPYNVAAASALWTCNALQQGVFNRRAFVTNVALPLPANARVQRVQAVGATAGAQPTISFTAVSAGGFAAEPVPRGLLHTIDVLGRCSNSGTITPVNCTWWSVEYVT
jgi:hypothetical protein